ncbi:helix-turn-helix domain-containing protein [Flavobacterium sp. ALJ2]|uniref:LexA family transcriptional regulator n=1 Tax=Flavobacterium sp. ALJ2 TaxID=2786960 RepID=UPI00189D8241|nr:S24 family peptidase [Flavobacterium sp. ALJ2]MBF7093569.1 helix-turn-helix domain-containing protein [Flavobacterium sp. ALJ2]
MKDKSVVLRELQKHLGFAKDGDFARFLGIKHNTLSNWYSRGTMDYDLIIQKCDNINANWLLTGKGDILKQDVQTNFTQLPKPIDTINVGIPLVDATAIEGFGNNTFSIENRDVKEFYAIPKFKTKKIDFMIEVEGSSMYPKYSSGDIVACTIIKESSFIQWNKAHVIATKEQGIILKRIKKGSHEENLCMTSDNVNYDSFEIPKNEIKGIALVVGVIRLE